MRELERTQRDLVTAIGGNGGGYAAGDLNEAQTELVGLADAAVACVDRLDELGVQVKDLDAGSARLPRRCATATEVRALLAGRRGRRRVLARHRRGLRRAETDRLGRIGAGDVRLLAAPARRRRGDRPRDRSLAKLVDWRISRHDLAPGSMTRYRVLRRTLFAVIIFVGVMSALLVIPQVRAIAGGVLASSAVIGLVIGFASQRTIGNVVAGRPDRDLAAAAARGRGRGRRARRGSSRRSASPTPGSAPATTTGSSSRTRSWPRIPSATPRSGASRRSPRSPSRCLQARICAASSSRCRARGKKCS